MAGVDVSWGIAWSLMILVFLIHHPLPLFSEVFFFVTPSFCFSLDDPWRSLKFISSPTHISCTPRNNGKKYRGFIIYELYLFYTINHGDVGFFSQRRMGVQKSRNPKSHHFPTFSHDFPMVSGWQRQAFPPAPYLATPTPGLCGRLEPQWIAVACGWRIFPRLDRYRRNMGMT